MITKISSGMQSTPMLNKSQPKVAQRSGMNTAPQHDSVSFGGINAKAAKLANSEEIAKVIGVAREVVGKKSKDVNKLVSSAVNEVMNGQTGEAVKKLSEKSADVVPVIQNIAAKVHGIAGGEIVQEVKSAKALGKTKALENAKKAFTSDGVKSRAMGILGSTLEDYKAVEGGKLLKNEKFHKILESANANSAVFNAAFALGLAGILRPATIYAMPTKNKDDNAYAAGHSISSGLIGFAASMLINNPLANAIKNVRKNPQQYLKDETIQNLGKVTKNGLNGAKADIATKYINLGTELAFAIPQACATIALVPLMLKHVFHLEKGKGKAKPEQAQQAQQQVAQQGEKKVSFSGAPVDGKKVGPIKHLLSKGVAAIMNNKTAQKLFDKTAKSDVNIVQHLSAAKGLLISGMYAYRTLTNDKLESERKRTLAVNQIGVSLVSTVLGYTFSIAAGKKIDKIAEKFMAANLKKVTPDKMGGLIGGIKAASSLMIFSTVYRYLSPVLVTPIANKIGSIINEKHSEKA
ncbi:hypothetical protein IJ732_05125 [bacterium]|nr:hypothetical protein [bacterium]